MLPEKIMLEWIACLLLVPYALWELLLICGAIGRIFIAVLEGKRR